jgi:hypothetical protein
LYAAVVFSQARDALLGEAKADGPRYGLAKLNNNSEEHGLQEVRIVHLIGQYGTLAGPGMKLSHR